MKIISVLVVVSRSLTFLSLESPFPSSFKKEKTFDRNTGLESAPCRSMGAGDQRQTGWIELPREAVEFRRFSETSQADDWQYNGAAESTSAGKNFDPTHK
jgi:hypothetical protein